MASICYIYLLLWCREITGAEFLTSWLDSFTHHAIPLFIVRFQIFHLKRRRQVYFPLISGHLSSTCVHKYAFCAQLGFIKSTWLPVSYLCEKNGQHVLPLKADGQMDQGVTCIKRRGPVKKLHLVGSELPGDVPSRGLVCFYCRQVSFHHACSPEEEEEGRSETNIRPKKAQCLQWVRIYVHEKNWTARENKS